jgi:hypothetical protein
MFPFAFPSVLTPVCLTISESSGWPIAAKRSAIASRAPSIEFIVWELAAWMTTESFSPVSRIVMETFSRPPGERSTSISLTGAVEDPDPAAGALARGAASVFVAVVIEALGSNDAPPTKGAESCAPNGLDGVADEAADKAGSCACLSGAAAFDPAGAGEAELEAWATGAGAAISGFRPLRTASCAAARERLGRFCESAGEAVGGGAIPFAIEGTASVKGSAGAAAPRAKLAREALSPSISVRSVRLAAAGVNGASVAKALRAGAQAGLEAPKWKVRSPISRPTFALAPPAMDAPPPSDFGAFAAGRAGEGKSSAACGNSFIIAAARKANGNDAMSALSLSSEW